MISRRKKAYKLIGGVLFSIFFVCGSAGGGAAAVDNDDAAADAAAIGGSYIFPVNWNIVLCLKLSVSIFTICNKNRTTKKN